MNIYLKPDTDSRGIMRVVHALEDYAPSWVDIVQRPQDADLEVIHVYGRYDSIKQRIEGLQKVGKPYAMIQYAIRSTMHPNTRDWWMMWSGAVCVWSYYDLPQLIIEDEIAENKLRGMYAGMAIVSKPYCHNFYHSPLGVDPNVFNEYVSFNREYTGKKKYVIAACSQHALAEGARECAFAAKRVKRDMFFLGHELRRGSDIVCKNNLTDEELAQEYSECDFVSGLRRIEGFELPVIEGALCGARPIVFDQPHYRQWFNEFAIFIPEGNRESVIDQLEKVFTGFYGQINENDKMLIRDRFNWSNIINGFYERLK